MKIDNSIKTVGGLAPGESKARSVQGSTSGATAGDKVELSSFSASMQQAEAAMAEVPVVDKNRVDELKQAITEGHFKVDAEKVADGLIESVRQMLEAQPHKA